MASYRVRWKKSAQKELRKIEKDHILKVLEFVENLSENPYPTGSRKLRGSQHTFRFRIGDYRVVYSVQSEILTIEIIRIGHRKDIYRRLR
jgi:mRNA interferase RelE/StbE